MDGFIISDVLVAMQAMQRRELKVFYQPKVDATTSRMKSAEALIRWVKEDGSVILPNQFLPAMEQTGAIAMLDWYVVESVCAFLERLKNLNIEPMPVSVNFSRWHLREEDMPKHLAEIVDSHHLDRRLIVVELTESTMIQEEERMRKTVAELHENGFEFSIDDFGSGLSSLQFIKDMPIDILKIDRSLLSSNCQAEKERIVLESIFYFANRLKLDTIAEGVETKEQLDFAREIGCELVQGFYFQKPESLDEVLYRIQNGDSVRPCETPEEREEMNRKWLEQNA
jgi:EAL domain-containing protein (putative c-di-GMP-specific phosphodiesterase class I)